jgi:hypothetical protein
VYCANTGVPIPRPASINQKPFFLIPCIDDHSIPRQARWVPIGPGCLAERPEPNVNICYTRLALGSRA